MPASPAAHTERTRADFPRRAVLALVALTVLAFNLRPAAISVAPVLKEIRSDLGMSATVAGLLTTLPVLCFAFVGAGAPWLAKAVGVHRTMLAALAAMGAGILIRAATGSTGVFLLASGLALAGIATANVMLPSLVKWHFPLRIGMVTAVYTTSLALGLTLGSVATVPVADLTGSWRGGLAIWAVAAAVGVLLWLGLVGHDVAPPVTQHPAVSTRQLLHSPLAWAMAGYFGLQSLQAYALFGWLPQIFRDAGFSAIAAGALLGIVTAVSIPVSFALPHYAARRADQRGLVVVLGLCYVIGYAGVLSAPVTGAWLWALLLGIGGGAFPLFLTLLGLRAHTDQAIAALSGFTQGLGYLLAAIGPFGLGLLYDHTGGWTVALWLLMALMVPQVVAGLFAARPRYLEDELITRTLAKR